MGTSRGTARRVTIALGWPFGIAYTAFHYLWRVLPVYREDSPGTLGDDMPAPIPGGVSTDRLMQPNAGHGPLFHRRYEAAIADATVSAERLIGVLAKDPNAVAPNRMARFHKVRGSAEVMSVGDEFTVRMPGPWDGPIRVVDIGPRHFRFATLEGHLEAGQIEWRAWSDGQLQFAVESWSRSGDRFSAFLHDGTRMAKEVQLYMWTTVLERVAKVAGGTLVEGVHVRTRRVDPDAFE